jgi:hypothetical protein
MVITCDVTAATATGDTVETTIGTVTLPSTAKRILGIGVSLGGAGYTTLEGISGFFRVEISNLDVTPGKFPLGSSAIPVTSGVAVMENKIYPVDWSPVGNGIVTFKVTMDMTLAINPTARGFVIFEK